MDSKELLQYRSKLIRDAQSMVTKPERTPNVSFFITWKIQDAGYKLSEALADYEIMRKVVIEHQEKYGWDAIVEMGNRNQYNLVQYLGDSYYYYNDDNDAVEYTDFPFMEVEDFAEYAKDPKKFLWEKALGRKFKFWDSDCTPEFVQGIVKENAEFGNYSFGIMKEMNEKYSIPMSMRFDIPTPQCGIEFFYSHARGIKNISVDMRRNAHALDDALDAFHALWFYPQLEAMKKIAPGIDPNVSFDCNTTILAHTIMNRKQWEKYFWPYLEKVFDVYAEKGWNTRYFTEGEGKISWEYIKDYPKGIITIHIENDDIWEAKKLLPNACLMGGMKNEVLGTKSKQECIDLAKHLIDEIGFDGGYIMSQDKLGTFKIDGKSENVKAVCDFVREYTPSQN